MDETTKKCAKCGETKSLDEYYKSKRKCGYQSICKTCEKAKKSAYYEKNKESINEKNNSYRKENKEKVKQKNREWYENNKQRNLERTTAWRKENPERSAQFSRSWESRNADAVREAARARMSRPKSKLERAIRSGVYKGIKKGSKSARKTFDLLGYTTDQLMDHIEKQFLPGMSWENHGRGDKCWHIDHIIPVAAFNYESPDDYDFKTCWSLKNLRPLWEKENLAKGDKLLSPFQPSLMLREPANDNHSATTLPKDAQVG